MTASPYPPRYAAVASAGPAGANAAFGPTGSAIPTMPDPLDFSLADRLPDLAVGQGRLRIGAPPQAGRPSLLFVPGAYHGAWCYAHYLDYFAKAGLGCAALDLRGHGGLPQDAAFASATIADLAEDVVSAVAAIGGPVVLVGHSMGALPALLAAERLATRHPGAEHPDSAYPGGKHPDTDTPAPERRAAEQPPTPTRSVAGVVLMAPSPPGDLPGALGLPAVPVDALRAAPGAPEIRARFLVTSPDRDVSAVTQRLNAESPQVLNDRYLLRVAVDAARIRVPGLCLEAGLDTHDRHPPGQDQAIARRYGFSHQVLADQPHCMMYADHWQISAAAILAWHQEHFG